MSSANSFGSHGASSQHPSNGADKVAYLPLEQGANYDICPMLGRHGKYYRLRKHWLGSWLSHLKRSMQGLLNRR